MEAQSSPPVTRPSRALQPVTSPQPPLTSGLMAVQQAPPEADGPAARTAQEPAPTPQKKQPDAPKVKLVRTQQLPLGLIITTVIAMTALAVLAVIIYVTSQN